MPVAFDGRVRISDYVGGYGNLVVVRHANGLETFYGHLSKRNVEPGEWVNDCELAADFSALATMLHIRFNYVLRKKAGVLGEEDRAYIEWTSHYANQDEYYKKACSCDVQQAFAALGVGSLAGRNKLTRDFLEDTRDAMAAGNLDKLDGCIAKRELDLKTTLRSKIEHATRYCGNWFGGHELTYRFEVALSFAREIRKAIGEEPR